MEYGFYHPAHGYWQAIAVSQDVYTVIVEPERIEIDDDDEMIIVPAITRETTQLAELLASYPDGTIQVPLKPGPDYELQGNEWVYVEPVPAPNPVPPMISRRQFYDGLVAVDRITKSEALAAMKTGTIPSALQTVLDGMTDDDARYKAEMKLIGATDFGRDDPLVMVFAISQGMSEADVDQFWRDCYSL